MYLSLIMLFLKKNTKYYSEFFKIYLLNSLDIEIKKYKEKDSLI